MTDLAFFFDFDNTITEFDVLDEIIQRFSTSDEWTVYENEWQEGKIGSKECLEAQVALTRVTRSRLMRFLSTVTIDPGFRRIVDLLGRSEVRPTIVSDGFLMIIETVLRRNGITGLPIVANGIRIVGDKLIPAFPWVNPRCSRCANCKRERVAEGIRAGKKTIYVGDGLSDTCPAEQADVVFAKGKLAEHCARIGKPHIGFDKLDDVYDHLRRHRDGQGI